MKNVFVVIVSLLVPFVMVDPSAAEDHHLTIIGSWQIEDVRAFSTSVRQSGKKGQIGYFLAPLSDDREKNGLFYISCVGERLFLDLELQQLRVDLGSVDPQRISVNIKSQNYALQFDMQNSFIEHDMLKIPVTRADIAAFGEIPGFELTFSHELLTLKKSFDMRKSQEAISDFLHRCKP